LENAELQLQQRWCFASPGGQRRGDLVADGEGLVTDAVGLAAGDDAAGSGAAGDAEGTAIARGRGTVVGIAAEVPAVPAGSLGAASATVPWPDTSSAIAMAATVSRRAAAQAARAVRKPVSSSPELTASRSLARPAGRA
jgi:hypothetical protein